MAVGHDGMTSPAIHRFRSEDGKTLLRYECIGVVWKRAIQWRAPDV